MSPIYDFYCDRCGHEQEFKLSMAKLDGFKAHGFQCQKCKDGMMRQKIGATPTVNRANLRISQKRKKIK